jgi:Amt family ammonium transporter
LTRPALILGLALTLLVGLLAASPTLAIDDAAKAADSPKPLPEKVKTEPTLPKDVPIDSGSTAWMLVSTGLVLLMVPGLALFYAGMVRRKNVLGTMMHSFVAMGLIGIQWVLFGYCLAFGASQLGLIGWNTDFLGLWNVKPTARFPGTQIPVLLHCMYQGMFAIITPALISGAIAERVRFGPYCLFLLLWATLVYDPLAHWVWAVKEQPALTTSTHSLATDPVGWLGAMGAIDFAGGTVVHISAGFSALAAILILRKRRGYPEHAMHPNSMVLTLLGAGLLWFGWFGFNGGSALGSGPLAASALGVSQIAAAAAAIAWMFAEWLHKGKPTALGFASGLVAGLVAITPASGFVKPLGALAIGVAAGLVCYGAVCLKPKLKYDDSLDAFGVHGIGGFLGAVLTGVFVAGSYWMIASGYDANDKVGLGALDKGPGVQIGVQLLAATVAAAYAFVVTYVIVVVLDKTVGFNLDAQAESAGLDQSEHGEVGFDLSPATEMVRETAAPEPRPALVPPDGKRHFTVVLEGTKPEELMHVWSELCQPGTKPAPEELKAVYPYVTTVEGNRFHFRGGDPGTMRQNLQRLFEDRLNGALKSHVEN